MKKFFAKVEANKPLASRFTSAEIFVVCLDYIAPDIIDEQLFDPKIVFQDTESDITLKREREIISLDKLMKKRTNREGFSDSAPMLVFKTMDFEDFLKVENPFPIFIEYSSIKLSE